MSITNATGQNDAESRLPACRIARRQMFKMLAGGACTGSFLAAAVPNILRADDFSKPIPGSEGLSAYCNGQQLLIRWNNVPIGAYRAHRESKFPYLTSLAGPITGSNVTTESSLPYPHHRGVWLGCHPLNSGDYWSDRPTSDGQIISTGLRIVDARQDAVTFVDTCEWVGPNGNPPCIDQRKFTVRVPSDRLRLIDVEVQLTALEEVVIPQAKHSFFALRAAPDISPAGGGTLVNCRGGIGAAETHGQVATWCSFFGPRKGHEDVVEGIALMDHPKNPWSPCRWWARDYGHLSPSPFSFNEKPWRLDSEKSIQLRYLIVVHAGTPQDAGLDKVYEEWSSA